MDFKRGQRVRLTTDYPVGDIMLPDGSAGIIIQAGRGISEVRFPGGHTYLVENEFLDFLEEGFPGVGDEVDASLEQLRWHGDDLFGGSHTGREIPEASGDTLKPWYLKSSYLGDYGRDKN